MRLLVSSLLFSLVACSGTGSVRIKSISGFDPSREDTLEIDTSFEGCTDAEGACTPEPYGIHYAKLVVVNERPDIKKDDSGKSVDALEATEFVTGYTVTLEKRDPGPTIAAQDGSVTASLPPNVEVTIVVPLAGDLEKGAFATTTAVKRYVASFELIGDDGLSVLGSAAIEIGPFNICPAGTTPEAQCP